MLSEPEENPPQASSGSDEMTARKKLAYVLDRPALQATAESNTSKENLPPPSPETESNFTPAKPAAVLGIKSASCACCGSPKCNLDRVMAEPGELYCDDCWTRWERCGVWQPNLRVSTRPPLLGTDGRPTIRPEDAFFLPGFMCDFGDLSFMERLRSELPGGRDFIEWHGSRHLGIQFEGEGARHDGPEAPPALQAAVQRLETAFGIRASASRLNLYRSNRDYKPLHFDRGRDNNGTPQLTVGASFGATRELTFVHVRSGLTATFPQNNGDVFAFTPELNQVFVHGVPRITAGAEDDVPRLSLIIWGARIPAERETDTSKEPASLNP